MEGEPLAWMKRSGKKKRERTLDVQGESKRVNGKGFCSF